LLFTRLKTFGNSEDLPSLEIFLFRGPPKPRDIFYSEDLPSLEIFFIPRTFL